VFLQSCDISDDRGWRTGSEMVTAGATVTKHNYAGRCHKRKLIT